MDKISSGVITLAIVGKPNVGKSTFFNKVLNKDLSPVSEIPGTTTDLFIDNISYKNRTFKLIDSGGLKRKAKSKSDEQQYITKESLKAIYLADVVLFMIEADKEFTRVDWAGITTAHGYHCIRSTHNLFGEWFWKLLSYINSYFSHNF